MTSVQKGTPNRLTKRGPVFTHKNRKTRDRHKYRQTTEEHKKYYLKKKTHKEDGKTTI